MSSGNATQTIGNVKLDLRVGNIAMSDTDAVVNAANEYLNLGAGVSGAIRELGGDMIQKELNEIGFCAVGSAVVTTGGRLKAKYVIHAVGPMYGEGDEATKLRSAVQTALKLADDRSLKSITLPAIGAGFFHYPIEECANVIVGAIRDTAPSLKNLNHVTICLKSDTRYKVFEKALAV
jgi:O-acetyl-ADP-ribose deacetylase (regulator of RNase III)